MSVKIEQIMLHHNQVHCVYMYIYTHTHYKSTTTQYQKNIVFEVKWDYKLF